MKSDQLKDTIAFALDKEKEAVEFYKTCSEQSTRSGMRQAFLEMAAEEKKHVQMLENFRPQNIKDVRIKEIPNLKISDYLVDMEFTSEMSYQDLLILAMKREESAYKMYSRMVVKGTDPSVEKLFRFMAQEELKHKNRLEKEYDDFVLQEN
jgi:rubrerythrin